MKYILILLTVAMLLVSYPAKAQDIVQTQVPVTILSTEQFEALLKYVATLEQAIERLKAQKSCQRSQKESYVAN